MTALTGLTGVDWVVLFAGSICVGLVAQAGRVSGGRRVMGMSVAAVMVGGACLVALIVGHRGSFDRLVDNIDRFASLAALVVILGLAAMVVDFSISHILPRVPHGQSANATTANQAVVLSVIAVIGLGLLAIVAERAAPAEAASVPTTAATIVPTTVATTIPATTVPVAITATTSPAAGRSLELVASHVIPGNPMGIALWRSGTVAFVSLEDGRIVMGDLSGMPDGPVEFTVVAEALERPRGLAVLGDRLVLAEIGVLPCEEVFCPADLVNPDDPLEGQVEILQSSSGRIVVYDIDPSGALSNRRVVVEDLPVAGSLHGINGVLAIDDDTVLVAVGNAARDLYPDRVEAIPDLHREWLGTVLEIDLDGRVRVHARGLRNVYGLARGQGNDIWGVDNDGPTFSGWRSEEVLLIERADEFGYPFDGTLGPWQVRTKGPVWIADTVGSAGILWAGDVGLGPGLVLGSCGRLHLLRLSIAADGRWLVADRSDYVELQSFGGCATAIASPAPGIVLVTMLAGEPVMNVFEVTG